jgi:D-alanyl-D-alanine dipeptidase
MPSEKTMKTICLLAIAAVAAATAVGCMKYTKPVVSEPEMTEAQRNFQVLWLATQDVLREYNFVIDRHDRRAGVITTKPLTGMQFFEPWRKDAVTGQALLDSSLKTLHRTVTIQIRPTDTQAGQYEPIVEVTVSKPNPPPQEIHSTGSAYDMFVLPKDQEDALRHGLLDYTPQPLGEPNQRVEKEQSIATDEALAKRLTEAITGAAAKRLAAGKWSE